MNWLAVDTSVVSYILKKHSLAPAYWEILKGHRLGISFMTVAELYCWPLRHKWGEKRRGCLSFVNISAATPFSLMRMQ